MPLFKIPLLLLFIEGLASFFSPCILPLLPVYISYLGGSTVEEIEKNEALQKTALFNTIGFVLGISLTFVLLGAGAGAVGRFFFSNNELFRKLGAVVIIIFGFYYLDLLRLPFLDIGRQGKIKREGKHFKDAFILGLVFSFGWTPCVGPLLGSALMMAAGSGNFIRGMFYLGIYAAGLALPFLVASLFLGKLLRLLPRVYGHFSRIKLVSGLLLIALGLLQFFGKIN